MFEKEAEEYARQNNPAEYGVRATHFTVLNSFKDGAEFGYNKANEWHYPSKGEYPKDEKDMLMSEQLILLIKMKGTDCSYLALGQYNFSTQEFIYRQLVGLTDVIAWKEIVLPKESEQ